MKFPTHRIIQAFKTPEDEFAYRRRTFITRWVFREHREAATEELHALLTEHEVLCHAQQRVHPRLLRTPIT